MYRLKSWAICWFVTLLFSFPLRAEDTPDPEYLTVRNGLPQGFVKSLIQDNRGFIWLATRDGLCRYDGVHFRIYTHDPQRSKTLSFSSIYEIKDDKQNTLWLRTENNNIDSFDPVTEQAKHISYSIPFQRALGRDQLVGIQPDHLGNVWVATQTNGFFRLNANGTISHRHWAIKGDTVQRVLHALLLDRFNQLWLAAQDGLFKFDPASGQFAGFRQAQGLPQNEVYGLHERASGDLMLGFPGRFALFDSQDGRVRQVVQLPGSQTNIPLFARDFRGVDYINQSRYTDQTGLVSLLSEPSDRASLSTATYQPPKLGRFSAVSILVDRTNVLWIGLNGDGVIKYDLNKRPFQTMPYQQNFQTDWLTQQYSVPLDAIPASIRQESSANMRYQFDRRKNLWITTPQKVPYQYSTSKKTFAPVKPKGIESRWLLNGDFRLTAMSTGAQGELWGLLGPHNRAVVRYNPDQENFTAFPLTLPPNHPYEIMAMVVDGGRVYLATKNHGLLRADLSIKRLIHWHSGGNDARTLPGDALLCLAQDPLHYNYLWIGTFGEGLCRLDKMTGKIQRFTVGQVVSNNVIYAIRTDGNGHLWLSTNRGLCRFDTRTNEARNYMADDGLPDEEFKQFHDVALPDGRLIFGGTGGYTTFDPRKVREDSIKPTVALTALRINNQLVNATTPGSPIQEDINETVEIDLDHRQNFLSIDFAALEFNQSHKNQYRYKLVGLDKDWVYSGNQSTATYTNLPPNTYTFVVNASNTSSVWSPHTHSLRIIISPPLWATWWAYMGYALLLLGAIVLFLKVRINRIRLTSRMELREQESIQLKHLDEIKSRFFANITHEFRTPLTLILTPLEQVLNDSADSPYHNRLSLIYRNANRLLRLINELLDLAKLDAGNLTINPTAADLSDFINRTVTVFMEEAQRKHIKLEQSHNFIQPFYWFDPDKIEKILTNLLSNALKFTNEYGTITVSTFVVPSDSTLSNSTNTDFVRIMVYNTGAGIPEHQVVHIFNRFYQADPMTERSVGGSGIGLALVKELVEMMQGTISVESNPTLGTTFTVELPFRQARRDTISTSVGNLPLPMPGYELLPANHSIKDEKVPFVLLVEDDDDIADFVVTTLNTEWRVQRVNNGKAGVETAITTGPDFIISDVLMPEMNGYELCRQLKSNPITSHIPILLLTAKISAESRLEGLSAGADDYLAKPFQMEELRGRIRNRLAHQQQVRHYYRTQLLGEGYLPLTSEAPEDDFMNRIYTLLEHHLDDSTFGVEPLASAIGMSRMHLNRKVKAMTGLTPNELIRVVRLKRAAELLLIGGSISEVADRVGFDTPAYFSKVFKEHYLMTPSEYVEQHRQELIK
ncbi:hybrid sensor histidine kinase/response regulator transcription factor [Spirosoma pollinicola]|uniref:histidine kinase n=1 Tax=Spirosoma pollinicola TaxID=2057025 RepID=A0A2K8YYX9_9BACT|nr:hybrid sensor histidine kinase/response regulator transcription factor [Spirosoma pollinicola]AUD02850.1 hybrid sensor histidine kinase/response regulator [Spirosoma pollinicola]